jgi:hypothetical protein
VATAAVTFTALGTAPASADPTVHHVLLLSLDGFHDFDLTNYIAAHPSSALATLVSEGRRYSHATTQTPSDSFPTTLAMTTGGSPRSTGVYYDVTWDNNLSPAKDKTCSTRGTVVSFNVSKNSGSTVADINPDTLPRDPANGCTPVYPHQYLKVNTIYEVAHNAGLRTAVSDKHPSYEILAGPSGQGIDDFFSPEFNSAKNDISLIMANDQEKVDAVLHQIDGYDHTGTAQVGVPAIFGMNFQAPNIGQKLSGYSDAAGTTPNDVTTTGPVADNIGTAPGLAQALDYVDGAVASMLNELKAQRLLDDTTVILTSKHGNSPVDSGTVKYTDSSKINDVINGVQPGLAAQVTADTMALIWLTDRSKAAEAAKALQQNKELIGAGRITSGPDVAKLFGGQLGGNPSRIPDIVVQPAKGVLYASAGSKWVDHGSGSAEDTHVPLVVVDPHGQGGVTISCPVSLRQVAPTILQTLGLDPGSLDAVRLEGTKPLPNESDCD